MTSSEFQLLLACARAHPDSSRISALAASGIDWRLLWDLAEKHQVRPLVCQSLHAVGPALVPEDSWRDIWPRNRDLARRNLLMTTELLRVAAVFAARQIPVAALKGPVLGQLAYGSFGLREFRDLDLLVHQEDFLKASDLLVELGYQPGWNIHRSLKVDFLRYQGESWFTSARGPSIDLHFRLSPQNTALPLDAEAFWPLLVPVPLAGRTVLSLAPSDLPLYLASQGGQDQWSDLRRICDLAGLLSTHPTLDWDSLLAAARRLRGLRNLLLGLHLASHLLDAPLPEAVFRAIRADPALPALAAQAVEKLQSSHPSGELRRIVFQLRVQERLRDRLRLALGLLTDRTDSDGLWLLLPKPLWPLYRLLRPLRMLSKLIRKQRSPTPRR